MPRSPASPSYLAFVRSQMPLLGFGLAFTFLSSGGQTFLISVFVPSFRDAFGIGNAAFGTLYAGATLASALLLPWAGAWMDRIRLTRFSLAVVGLLAGSALVVAVAPHPAVLALGLVGLRLSGQGLSGQTALTAMGRYFERGRGRAMSVVSLGFPLGEAFLPLLVVGGIGVLGWRPTWGVIAAVVLLGFGPLLVWLLGRSGVELDPRRARPLDVSAAGPGTGDQASAAGGGTGVPDGPAPLAGWGRAKILRDPIFWLALPAALLPPFWITGIFLYQTAIAELKGWPLPLMASAFIAFAATRVLLSLAAGSWIDRVSARRLFPLTPLPLAVGFGLLWVGGAGWIAHAFMGAFGIAAGLSGPVKSALWAELWGLRHLGAVQTMMAALMVVSTAASPVLVGAALDAGLPLERLLVIGLASVAAGVVLSLPVARAEERAPRRTGSGSDG